MTKEEIIKYCNQKIRWLNKKCWKTFEQDLHVKPSDRRAQELMRDIKIVLRQASLTQDDVTQLYQSYKQLRFTKIAGFIDWLEISGGKK